MAIMIPSTYPEDTVSEAEKTVFEWFKNAPGTSKWYVLHSLLLSEHEKVIKGECDFVVIAPQYGVFALEVKGGRVERTNEGTWVFTSREGRSNEKKKSPFAQVNQAGFAIAKYINENRGANFDLGHVRFASGVVFPDITFNIQSPEWSSYEIFDQRNGCDVAGFIKNLSMAVNRKASKLYNTGFYSPSVSDAAILANILRPAFDCVPSISSMVRKAEKEMITLTEQEYDSIDSMELNQRMMFLGPAGTGKTLIALQYIRRTTLNNICLVCFNKKLAEFLKLATQDFKHKISFVGTFSSLVYKNIYDAGLTKTYLSNDTADLLPDDLTNLFVQSLTIHPLEFDVLLVDEMQDLTKKNVLEAMDAMLFGGLRRGSWYFFADYENQTIFNGRSDSLSQSAAIELISAFAGVDPAKKPLTINCRNTKKICTEIKNVTGVKYEKMAKKSDECLDVNRVFYSSKEEELSKLKKEIFNLISRGINKSEITILSPACRCDSIVSAMPEVEDYSVSGNMGVSFSTVQSFKGLENDFIILVDLGSYLRDGKVDPLIYVALSRARVQLTVFETNEQYIERSGLLLKGAING